MSNLFSYMYMSYNVQIRVNIPSSTNIYHLFIVKTFKGSVLKCIAYYPYLWSSTCAIEHQNVFILPNCNLVPVESFPSSPGHYSLWPLKTTILISTSLRSTLLCSANEWDHVAFVLLCLPYFIHFHSCCCEWQDFIHFYGWMAFHCPYVPCFLYWFISL
jgi:hypothetical protein